MSYRPQTAAEINQFRIERILKKLSRGEMSMKDCKGNNLYSRFDRLKKDNEGMYIELYAKFVEIVRSKSMLSLN